MQRGERVIYQAALRDAVTRTYGVADFLMRSDELHRLFPNASTAQEASIPAPDLGGVPWHYRVIDIKYTTLHFLANKEVYYREFEAEVPSLAFLGHCRLVVIQDEPGNLDQKTMRVLITDVMDLTVEQILTIYRRRWKEETYHQIIKDRLGVKAYKHRRLKAIMRFLELADVAYCFLEYRRLKDQVWESSLSEVRNALIRKAEYRLFVKFNLQLPKRLVANG